MWFEKLTGFKESPESIRQNLRVEGHTLISNFDGRSWHIGELQIATLSELRKVARQGENLRGQLKVSELVADVRQLHADPSNRDCLFQAASQFNLLEMVSPHITPEQGIDRYAHDYTQGPACAISCGAGTIYRNYFVPVGDQMGQSSDLQIDCLELIGRTLDNPARGLWQMNNGYALPTREGLKHIDKTLTEYTPEQYDDLKSRLKVGIQWDTQVTIAPEAHHVSQIYCAALPVAYGGMLPYHWETFARLILEATYEATLYAAYINLLRHASPIVYLTMVGGGVFGNQSEWIISSIQKALDKFNDVPLDIRIVSYGSPQPELIPLLLSYG